jgi:hypothetical protein
MWRQSVFGANKIAVFEEIKYGNPCVQIIYADMLNYGLSITLDFDHTALICNKRI